MKGEQIPYSVAKLAWPEANRHLMIGEYTDEFNRRFERDLGKKNLHALRKRKRGLVGRTTKGIPTILVLAKVKHVASSKSRAA